MIPEFKIEKSRVPRAPAKPTAAVDTAAPWASRLTPVPVTWYAELPPKRDWFLRDARTPKLRGVLPRGKTGQIIAAGGGSKTMAVVQLAVAVATGGKWLGAFEVCKAGRALLVLGEEDAAEAQRRIHSAAMASRGPTPLEGSIVVLPLAGLVCPMLELDGFGNLVGTPFLAWLRTYVKSGNFDLVVIDPLSRFAGPNAETDNAAATRFVSELESLTWENGPVVLNAHHTNKGSRGKDATVDASSGRGSSAFVDGARWQCALSVERLRFEDQEASERLGEVVTFDVTKSNYAQRPDPVTLRRNGDHGGALVPTDAADAALIETARTASALSTAKTAAKAVEAARVKDAADEAVVSIVGERPGITALALRIAVKARAGCSSSSADTAIERMRGRLCVTEGKQGARRHTLREPVAKVTAQSGLLALALDAPSQRHGWAAEEASKGPARPQP